MRQRLRVCKRWLAFVLSLAMIITTVNMNMLTTEAAQEPINESYTVPFGGVIDYDETQGIGVVWGYIADYTSWYITISCADTGYSKSYTEDVCTHYFFPDTYEPGKTYTIEIQGVKDGQYSKPHTLTYTIPGESADPDPAESETPSGVPAMPVGVTAQYWPNDDANHGKIFVAWGPYDKNSGAPEEWIVKIDDEIAAVEVQNDASANTERGAAYFYENKYAAGDHTISVTAKNAAGESVPGVFILHLNDDQAGQGGETDPGSGEQGGQGGETDPGSGEQGGQTETGALVLAELETETYRSQDDGGWAGDSNVQFQYDGTSAVVTADNFGWNPWGIQWKFFNLTSAEESNVFEFDVVSTVSKDIVLKDENSSEMYTISLTANEPKHCAYNVTGTTFNATFDLSGGAVGGSLTFTNMKFAPGTVEEGGEDAPAEPVEGAIDFDTVAWETYRSQDDGGWAGDSNVVFNISGTTAEISADNFGWNPWGIQWKLFQLTSEEESNVFEFDVVSTVSKDIVLKDENTSEMYTISLKANEPQHCAYNVSGTTFNATFDLTGGAVGGKLTFTNMRFLPGTVEEGGEDDPADPPTYVEGAVNFDNVTWTTYRSQDDGGWAGDSNVVFNISGTTAVITADNFGWNPWGIQWAIKNLASDSDYNVFAFDVVSTVTKDIVFKDENSAETHTINLVAGQPQHLEYEISGSPFSATFDLSGGAVGGKLTFTNMTFGPASGIVLEAGPALTSSRKLDKANGFKVGEDVVLNLSYDGTEWAEKITALKINNKTIDGNYSVAGDVLTLNGSLFTKQGVYDIEVEADGYKTSEMSLPVYDADTANEVWTVQWEDQFNGTALDESKWSYEIGIQSGEDGKSSSPTYWGNNEKEYYTKEAVEVKDGYLVITGDRLTDAVKSQYGVTDNFVQYTSGRIRTVTDAGEVLEATTYGRIEAKMQLPAAKGYWPAFWMLPTPETTDLYGVWASSGELDIMEAVGQNPAQVNGTIHYGATWPNNQSSGDIYKFPEGEDISGEHLYAVEWEPGEIRWYVDDVLYHVENNWYAVDTNGERFAYPAPFDEDFYILFNLAMSGNYVSNVDPDVMGQQMKVDYVRVLTEAGTDYDKEVSVPSTERDNEFFEQYGGYTDLIKDKTFTTLPAHAYGDGGNLLPGNEIWWSAVNTGAGAAAAVEVANDAAKINVTKVGSNDYNVQLIQNVPLAKGYTYRMTFDAWTDAAGGRTIRVAPGGDCNHGWASYDIGLTPSLTSERKTFQFDFLMAAESDPSARLEMNLGGATGTVYIANVSVIALTDEQLDESDEGAPKEPLANGEHVYNGTFDKGTGRLGDWITEGTEGSAAGRNYTVTVAQLPTKLIQEGLQLLQNDTYKLTFDAKAANSGKIKAALADGNTVYAEKTYDLSADAETYELEFTVPEGKGTDTCRLEIEFLNEGETYVIDNISMKRLTNVNMEWSNYELYPIADLTGFTTYDEVWNWSTLPANLVSLDGEQVLAVNTTHASENWKVMLQRENVALSTGMTYHIRYAIKASADEQNVEVKIEDTTYSPCYDEHLTIGTQWQYVDTTFTSSLAGNGALKFCLGDVSQDCTVYVKDVSIELEGIPVPGFAEGCEVTELEIGDSVALQIRHYAQVQEKYESFTFESSDSDVLEVSEDGVLTAKSEGEAVITVTSNSMGTKFSFTVKVTPQTEDPDEGGDDSDTDNDQPGQGGDGSDTGNDQPGQSGSGSDAGNDQPGQSGSDSNTGNDQPGQSGNSAAAGSNRPGQSGNGAAAGSNRPSQSGNGAAAGSSNAGQTGNNAGAAEGGVSTINANNVEVAPAPEAAVTEPAGEVTAPAVENEETVEIEDEETSLAAAPEEEEDAEEMEAADENSDETVIAEEETPLASGTGHAWIWCLLLAVVVAAAAAAYVCVQQKKRNAKAQKKS